MFQEPKELLPNRQVEHDILFFPNSSLQNIKLYRQSILQVDEVKIQSK